jgi:hypothetical protein
MLQSLACAPSVDEASEAKLKRGAVSPLVPARLLLLSGLGPDEAFSLP